MKKKEFTEEEIKEACEGLTDEQAGRLRFMLNRQLGQERSYRRLTAATDIGIIVYAILSYVTVIVLIFLKVGGII